MRAVSAKPLRAPCVELKYSSTLSPSRKLALIGVSMMVPFGLAIRPRMPASWRICSMPPRAPEWAIRKIGFRYGAPSRRSFLQVFHHLLGDLVAGVRPQVDDVVVALDSR